jgi:hypothetical protein
MDWTNASQSNEGKNVLLRFKRYGKLLKFRAGTPMGMLSSVRVCKSFKPEPPPDQGKISLIAEMKTALEHKGITFQTKIMTGSDLDQMITLFYRNIDLYATCMKDLVGSDLIEYNKEIDPNQQPIRQKQFRFAKSERDEIEKQVRAKRCRNYKAINVTVANANFSRGKERFVRFQAS